MRRTSSARSPGSVLTLVELLRRLSSGRRSGAWSATRSPREEIEDIGLALMRLEETVQRPGRSLLGLSPDDLNLDLGPLGRDSCDGD